MMALAAGAGKNGDPAKLIKGFNTNQIKGRNVKLDLTKSDLIREIVYQYSSIVGTNNYKKLKLYRDIYAVDPVYEHISPKNFEAIQPLYSRITLFSFNHNDLMQIYNNLDIMYINGREIFGAIYLVIDWEKGLIKVGRTESRGLEVRIRNYKRAAKQGESHIIYQRIRQVLSQNKDLRHIIQWIPLEIVLRTGYDEKSIKFDQNLIESLETWWQNKLGTKDRKIGYDDLCGTAGSHSPRLPLGQIVVEVVPDVLLDWREIEFFLAGGYSITDCANSLSKRHLLVKITPQVIIENIMYHWSSYIDEFDSDYKTSQKFRTYLQSNLWSKASIGQSAFFEGNTLQSNIIPDEHEQEHIDQQDLGHLNEIFTKFNIKALHSGFFVDLLQLACPDVQLTHSEKTFTLRDSCLPHYIISIEFLKTYGDILEKNGINLVYSAGIIYDQNKLSDEQFKEYLKSSGIADTERAIIEYLKDHYIKIDNRISTSISADEKLALENIAKILVKVNSIKASYFIEILTSYFPDCYGKNNRDTTFNFLKRYGIELKAMGVWLIYDVENDVVINRFYKNV